MGQSWIERAAVLVVASFCITGCAGGGGDSASAPQTDTDTTSVTPSPSDSSNGSTPPSNQPPNIPVDANGNHAPTLSGTPATAVMIDTEYSFQLQANDADGDPLTLTVQNLPSWAQFDTSTRRLSGTPAAGDAGTYSNIVIMASDGSTTVAMPAFTIDVIATALGQVTVSWQAPTTNTDGSALTDLAGYKIYYGNSSENLNRVVQVTNAGLSSYVIDNLTPATYFFTVTAVNGSGTESARSALATKTL